jgi:hypothetical protein
MIFRKGHLIDYGCGHVVHEYKHKDSEGNFHTIEVQAIDDEYGQLVWYDKVYIGHASNIHK